MYARNVSLYHSFLVSDSDVPVFESSNKHIV